MDQAIHDFFTTGSILTFTGASAAVWVISTTFRILFNRNSIIFYFLVSMLVAFLGAYIAESLGGIADYFIAFLNGCLLFCTAAGAQETVQRGSQPTPTGKGQLQDSMKIKFLSSWFE